LLGHVSSNAPDGVATPTAALAEREVVWQVVAAELPASIGQGFVAGGADVYLDRGQIFGKSISTASTVACSVSLFIFTMYTSHVFSQSFCGMCSLLERYQTVGPVSRNEKTA
jgi:hypothetical protein